MTSTQERPARMRGELEGMMDAYVLSKLQDTLELSDEQFGQMVVAQKKLQDARRQYRRQRNQLLRELRQAVRQDSSSEEELETQLRKLEELKQSFADNERERYAAIDAILTVKQRARYRILEAELERRLQQLMRQVRRRRANQNR